MLIDLHCHTKECKTGDGPKRAVEKDFFIKKVNQAMVGVVAITNHNVFDLEQFNKFKNDDFMVWPGVELDVDGLNGSYGHCILIVSPDQAESFSETIGELTKNSTPDKYRISLSDLAETAKKFKSIVTCHYGKDPALSDESIKKLREDLGDVPLFLEPSKLISAGIYLAHNMDSLLGSDVKDWNKYEKYSFPELKLDVDSYEHFLLLIKKDKEIIKTFFDKKRREVFEVAPFENAPEEKIKIQLYNDTNVIIGGKGTGKTKILEAIQDHFSKLQNDSVSVYFGAKNSLNYDNLIKVELVEGDFATISDNNYKEKIKSIFEWQIPSVEKTSNYHQWALNKKEIKNFGFSKANSNEYISDKRYQDEWKLYKANKEHIAALLQTKFSDYITATEAMQLPLLLSKLLASQKEKVIDEYCKFQSLKLADHTITKMKDLYQIKKGKCSRPNKCGLLDLYKECQDLHDKTDEIVKKLNETEKITYKLIGKIPEKGYVYVRKHLALNPDLGGPKSKNGPNKKALKEIKNKIELISKNSFSSDVTGYVAEFKDECESNSVKSLESFLRVMGDVVLSKDASPEKTTDADVYGPSTGEKSMLILNNSLYQDKDIFILDEPELSVGHDFINTVIVPRIIELSKLNKTVVIATHDANIAVRTLPFMTMYRCGDERKKTYVGNPFMEEMTNICDENDKRSWAKTCIETLEGGSIAFRERGDSYGKENL